MEKTIEQRPFRDLGVQQFFTRWCSVNDGIVPMYVSRAEWSGHQETGILTVSTNKGKKNLYIPEDLHLWEMIEIMEAVDEDTYEQQPSEKTKELEQLAAMFKNAGAYIAQRLDAINEGRAMAAVLAEELYEYGDSLMRREKPKKLK